MSVKIDGAGNVQGTQGIQIGTSATAAQNFSLFVPTTPDGTIKLSRGNFGATTADILTVNAAGVISLTNSLPVASGGTGDTGTAWTSVVITPTATGSFGSASGTYAYKQMGKTVWWTVKIIIVSNGTASGSVSFVSPFVAARDCIGVGRETVSTGNILQSQQLANSANCGILSATNTYPGGNNYTLVVCGTMEVV